MTQPSTDNPKQAHDQQQQQQRNDSNNELSAEARVPCTTNDSELFVIETDSLNRPTFGQNNNSDRNLANEIQTLAEDVTADSIGAFSVDDVLILHYEPNNNNNNNNNSNLLQNVSDNNSNSVDNQLIHFNGILIRNKNNTNRRGRRNRFIREQLQRYQPVDGPSSNTPRSGNFDVSISTNNVNNLLMRDNESAVEIEENDINEAVPDDNDSESMPEERINDDGIAYNLNGNISERLTIDLTAQNDYGGVEDVSEMAELQNMEFQMHGRSRPSRRGRSRRRDYGRNRRRHHRINQMSRTLKKMNTILRKTTLTLRLIESLILQQRGWRPGPPTAL